MKTNSDTEPDSGNEELLKKNSNKVTIEYIDNNSNYPYLSMISQKFCLRDYYSYRFSLPLNNTPSSDLNFKKTYSADNINPSMANGYHPFYLQLMKANAYANKYYSHLLIKNIKNKNFLPPENSRFFIIKCLDMQSLHKALKYNKWTTSTELMKSFSEAYKETSISNEGKVYFFFSVNKTGMFQGLAEMTSDVNYEEQISYLDKKFSGSLNLDWIFIKGVKLDNFEDIRMETKFGSNTPVFRNFNGTSIEESNALQMIEIFKAKGHDYKPFEQFESLDIAEKQQINYNLYYSLGAKSTHNNQTNVNICPMN